MQSEGFAEESAMDFVVPRGFRGACAFRVYSSLTNVYKLVKLTLQLILGTDALLVDVPIVNRLVIQGGGSPDRILMRSQS